MRFDRNSYLRRLLRQKHSRPAHYTGLFDYRRKTGGDDKKRRQIHDNRSKLSCAFSESFACINFKAAAFTNLTGDHLDYHKTKQNYLEAKTKLFSSLAPDSFAVLNTESPESEYIAKNTKAKIIWYGIMGFQPMNAWPGWPCHEADLVANIESMDVSGTVFSLNYKGQSAIVKTPLIGMYNISNHLAAAGLCLGAGLDLDTIAAGLSHLKLIPGRLEKVDWDGNFTVLIDYAHTDDALKNVLSILKPLCKGKLRVIFGCGGDRDKTKRPRMAHVVEQFADFITVTSDNPRTENPQQIIDDILTGFKSCDSVQLTARSTLRLSTGKCAENTEIQLKNKLSERGELCGK